MYNILLAEDDTNLGALLVDFLESEKFNVTLCQDGLLALTAFQSQSFDLCLLDVMMPKMDGFTLAQEIRKTNSSIPILFVTAKTMKEDKLKGYHLGADDYISKPFDEEELLWRIKAILRRIPTKQEIIQNERIMIGLYQFDFSNQSLMINGQTNRITAKENNIINYLWQHRNKIIKREQILLDLWGKDDYFLGRSLDVFITKIRKYLKDDPNLNIENIFGVGFIFNVPEG